MFLAPQCAALLHLWMSNGQLPLECLSIEYASREGETQAIYLAGKRARQDFIGSNIVFVACLRDTQATHSRHLCVLRAQTGVCDNSSRASYQRD